MGKIISLSFTDEFYCYCGKILDLELMNFFEEFSESSHLRDELLMLLGFLSFEGSPVKNIVSMCVDVMNEFFTALLNCLSRSAKF